MECEYEKRKKCDSLYIERYNKLLKEIERINKQIEEYQKALYETTSEKIDLENIIKEVREYIEYYLTKGKTKNHKQFETSILEILDKGV